MHISNIIKIIDITQLLNQTRSYFVSTHSKLTGTDEKSIKLGHSNCVLSWPLLISVFCFTLMCVYTYMFVKQFLFTEKGTLDVWVNGQKIDTQVSSHEIIIHFTVTH